MPSPVNTRADLDALAPSELADLMTVLAGSIWRLMRDDANERWIAIEDLSSVTRFGFTREDFPLAAPPALPEWVPAPDPRETMTCSDLQALLALDQLGLADEYEAWCTDPQRTFAEKAFINRARTWRRLDATFNAAADALEKTEEEKDQLFALAVTL
ncbi:hypothetical protein [Thiocystis violacea]|uniref:hypothetical protein n=1 Tax=Thiocystis violacea TaxID=13725 RepID=UPI001905B148|nr:hypothetical protein [Thiocystis violacea]MBK1719229.1 hypothetical protein [Thiocystis violacea]